MIYLLPICATNAGAVNESAKVWEKSHKKNNNNDFIELKKKYITK